jgi:hypothetical protein
MGYINNIFIYVSNGEGESFDISGNPYMYGVDTNNGSVSINLPNANDIPDGITFYIFDAGDNAGTNNIQINAINAVIGPNSDNSILLNINSQSITLVFYDLSGSARGEKVWFII